MDYIKKILILILLPVTLLSFSKKPLIVDKKDFILLTEVTQSCHQEIRSYIKEMLGSNSVKLSEKPFTDSSYVDITNSSKKYFQFLLHKSDDEYYISRVIRANTIVKSKKLKNCRCE